MYFVYKDPLTRQCTNGVCFSTRSKDTLFFFSPTAGVCEEGRDDPALQVAQKEGRVSPARIPEVQPDGRLLREVPQLRPQPKADPLPLSQGERKEDTSSDSRGNRGHPPL